MPWQTALCGDSGFQAECFRDIVWILPTNFLCTLACAFYIGKHHQQKCRFLCQSVLIRLQVVVIALLFIMPSIRLLLLHYIYFAELYTIDYIMTTSDSLCWLSLAWYLCTLRPINVHHKSQIAVNLSFCLCFIIAVLGLHYIIAYFPNKVVDKYVQISKVIAETLYCLLLILRTRESIPVHSEFRSLSIAINESDPLMSSSYLTYGGFQEANDPHDLGVGERGGIFSKLFLFWVKPLINKGDLNLVHSATDLFDLPNSLHTSNVCSKFHFSGYKISENSDTGNNQETCCNSNLPLLKGLHHAFGLEYYSLGILKFLSDLLLFAGPVLLNLLVKFLEDENNRNSLNGYYFALAMFLSTFLGALCVTHYFFAASKIGLKVRAVLISNVYQKALYVNTSKLSKFSTGEIVNFMSTDTDRIVNICLSFHQFWSLPIQVGLCLYLLYQQIGYSSFVGLGFAILMIPLNQCIAKKIGDYSKLLMREKDRRIKLMSEILNGIRVVKMHAWENAFSDKIDAIRQQEIKYLSKRKYLDALCVYFWATTPVIISFLSFTLYALLGNTLTASRIFTSIALFNMLIIPLNAFPWVLNGLVEAVISMKRVQELLILPDQDLTKYYSEPSEADVKVEFSNAVFSHSMRRPPKGSIDSSEESSSSQTTADYAFHLGSLNLTIPEGKFVCVVGKVGSGKSTFLSSILGDISQISGKVSVPFDDWTHGIGLVPQEPWIQQASIRDNILFGKTINSLRYRNILEACALFDDLKILPHGDKTEVGERGITLSGGQRARIALARAAYQNFDLYLLDDPFAAVDAHVAEHIFNHCILGILKGKTIILCTHKLKFVEKADIAMFFEGGKVVRQGPPRVLPQLNFIAAIDNRDDSLDIDYDDPFSDNQLTVEVLGDIPLLKEEEKDSGILKYHVYKSYWNAIGSALAVGVLLSCIFMQASKTISDWWLSFWIGHSSNTSSPAFDNESDSVIFYATGNKTEDNVKFYLLVYGGIAAANSIFSLIRAFSFAYSGIKAAKILHNRLKNHIMKATMKFFCITPLGRMLNRFSSDVYTVDDSLPFMLNILLAQTFGVLGCLAVTVYSLPFIAVILTPLSVIYYHLQRYYRNTSRELKRISSITLSPIYAHFSETLSGHMTIRALASVPRFLRENISKLDANQQAQFATISASQWLNLRLQLLGVVFVSGIALVALIQHQFQGIRPELVGLALSYALTITALLSNFVTSFTETEKEMVSVERVMQYIDDVPSETEAGIPKPLYSWPSYGVVTFKNVFLQHEENGPLALQSISFETKRAEKLGIVGRTGSGKSSLIQALFRMVDICNGNILIDGVNISQLTLRTLRSHLSVVPQDPFLFSGTVRENLDPDGNHSDEEIWKALQDCHVKPKVQEFGGLDAEIEERGRNFSAGERQLLCLARTLLHKAKILCLDEATASIDQQTDSLLQLTIRLAFRHTTIFIVAHRIETVMDCDRVMVMGKGRILELDKPATLLSDPSSEFYQLVHGLQT